MHIVVCQNGKVRLFKYCLTFKYNNNMPKLFLVRQDIKLQVHGVFVKIDLLILSINDTVHLQYPSSVSANRNVGYWRIEQDPTQHLSLLHASSNFSFLAPPALYYSISVFQINFSIHPLLQSILWPMCDDFCSSSSSSSRFKPFPGQRPWRQCHCIKFAHDLFSTEQMMQPHLNSWRS